MSFFYYTPYKISQSPRRNHRGAHWAEKQPLQGMETASGKRTREHHDTDRPYNGNGRCSGPEDEHEHRQYRTITGGVLGEDDFNAEDSDEPSHTPSAVDRAGLAHHVDIPKVGARMQGPVGATAAEVNNAAAPAQLMVEDPLAAAPPSVNLTGLLAAPLPNLTNPDSLQLNTSISAHASFVENVCFKLFILDQVWNHTYDLNQNLG